MEEIENQRSVSYSAKRRALLGILCALFLSAQTADLTHSHDGDFLSQFECETCLQAASDDDDSVLILLYYFIFKNNCLRCCVVQYGWGVGRLIEKTDADNNNINVISIQQAAKK